MNYCTKCESFYQKPGTCNCFAGTQPAITITPQPYDPNSTAPHWHGSWQTVTPSGVLTTAPDCGPFTFYYVVGNTPQ